MADSPQCKMCAVDGDYHQVRISRSAQLSPYSSVVGRVEIGPGCTVFAGTHIRGDVAPISIGKNVNIQEGCALHVSAGSPLTVGDHVTVGHKSILHGCTIGENVLVGMGSIVMDDAKIGDNSLIAAGSLVTQRKVFEPGTLIMGSPARAVRKLTDEEIFALITQAGDSYCEVGAAMVSDGLMFHPTDHARVWPEEDRFEGVQHEGAHPEGAWS